ncbi:MAG: T9SS type A sorting domain-containing protein [Bacteroidia bacterium]|nr:T9SS type A sorting domain-containing protein [Bacteroidia bacterium]NNK72194.1 T9SS type A sorting domain-containing protein [Flavobacteriaceae bacterium]
MKNNYNRSKPLLLFLIFLASVQMVFSQVKIRLVNPTTGDVTIKNYSASSTIDITGWWLCNFPAYSLLVDQSPSGSLNLAPGDEVTVTSTVNINPTDAELGLYNTNLFGSSTAMEDYLQWGSASHQRESVAVSAGIWGAGTFIMAAPPFEYTGDGVSEFGVNFWQTALGLADQQLDNQFRLIENPIQDYLIYQAAPGITDYDLIIYGLNGRLISRHNLNNTNSTVKIALTDLSAGLYFAEIRSNAIRQVLRFVKK